jgi:hypothetical protein
LERQGRQGRWIHVELEERCELRVRAGLVEIKAIETARRYVRAGLVDILEGLMFSDFDMLRTFSFAWVIDVVYRNLRVHTL